MRVGRVQVLMRLLKRVASWLYPLHSQQTCLDRLQVLLSYKETAQMYCAVIIDATQNKENTQV